MDIPASVHIYQNKCKEHKQPGFTTKKCSFYYNNIDYVLCLVACVQKSRYLVVLATNDWTWQISSILYSNFIYTHTHTQIIGYNAKNISSENKHKGLDSKLPPSHHVASSVLAVHLDTWEHHTKVLSTNLISHLTLAPLRSELPAPLGH